MDLKILGIVPARGGSKGLPGKNIRPLNGKPLIGHTIDAAKASKYINKLVLTTDDDDIARVSSQFGIEIPFMRPSELATDTSRAIDTYIYTLKRLKDEFNYEPDMVVILQPTSPLRTTEDIDSAIQKFIENKADSVMSMCELEHPIERARVIREDGRIENYLRQKIVVKNRAEYFQVFAPNGVVFVLKPEMIYKKDFYSENTFAYVMPKDRSVDIDILIDFEIAEFLLKKRDENNGN